MRDIFQTQPACVYYRDFVHPASAGLPDGLPVIPKAYQFCDRRYPYPYCDGQHARGYDALHPGTDAQDTHTADSYSHHLQGQRVLYPYTYLPACHTYNDSDKPFGG
jgi:hypothetical protein